MNSLKHGFEEAPAGGINIALNRTGQNIAFIYGDTGKGIPGEHLKKIFEPFFTIKRGEGGSGLGMHIVYNRATQSLKGTIKCDDKPEYGT